MSDQLHNPFAGKQIAVPEEFHEAFQRYNHYKKANPAIDRSPFQRMIDFWFLSICVACRLGLDPDDISNYKTVKFADASIFGSNPWRIHTLMLIAISKSGDVKIVSDPTKMLSIANGLAVAGIPKVIAMLRDGDAEPIWNLSDAIDLLLRKGKTA